MLFCVYFSKIEMRFTDYCLCDWCVNVIQVVLITFVLCESSVRSQFVSREHCLSVLTVAPLQHVAGTRSRVLLRPLHHIVSLNSYSLFVASTGSSPQQPI